MKITKKEKVEAEILELENDCGKTKILILVDENYSKKVLIYNKNLYAWDEYFTSDEALLILEKQLQKEKGYPEEYVKKCEE